MANTYDVVAATTEKAATVRSISTIIGTALTDAKGHTCMAFSIQNKDGAKTLHLQDDNDETVANDNIEILPGQTYRSPTAVPKHDLREIFIRVSADDPIIAIEVYWG